MTPHRRIVARAVLLLSVAVGAAASVAAPAPAVAPAPGSVPSDPSASSLPEVRLRKLHLVRPDLIPYPVAYEVYC